MKEELYHITTEDNVSIALWKLYPKTPSDKHVFITHGTFSNKKICEGIGRYLTDKGFTCWIMEWRAHGASTTPKTAFNFETIASYDLKSTFDFLFNTQKINRIDCVTHSGGGVILTMFLIKHPDYNSTINSITLFGVQAFGAGLGIANRIKLVLGKYLAALLGTVPAKTAGSSEHNESYYTMKQWFNWNIKTAFIGEDGFNYLKRMPEIAIPILSICAKGDRFIAPKIGCEQFLNAFKNDANTLLYCSKENGYLEDYNHSRILKSQNSKQELYPIVRHWILYKNLM